MDDAAATPIRLPRVPERAEAFVRAFRALSVRAQVQVVHEWKKWQATADDGREALGLLNGRYELCVLECARPAPWIAAAFDTAADRRELVLAAFVPHGRAVTCRACAQLAALALGVSIDKLV